MKILMIVPKYPFPVVGGLERQAHELAKALLKRGHVIHALSSRFDSEQKDEELLDGIRIHRVDWIDFSPARFLVYSFKLAHILIRIRREIDLIHIHNISWLGAFVTLFAKILQIPVITKLPNIGDSGIPGIKGRLFGLLQIAFLKKSDAIIAMTPESIAELDCVGYSRERVLKVTNGIPLLATNIGHSNPHSSDEVTVVFIGRLVPQKGLADLLHAWLLVKARVSCSVKLCIIGDGIQKDDLKLLAKSLDLDGYVEFCGFCADIPAELAKADIFVLPSYAEGNSNAILEAMRAGIPVVSTRLGGAAIQVGSRGERFLVQPGDRNALAERLIELIEDKALRLQMGAEMSARIENLFAIDRVAAVYEQAYELVISGRRHRIGELNPDIFR